MAVSLGIDMAKEMGITKLEIQMDNEACVHVLKNMEFNGGECCHIINHFRWLLAQDTWETRIIHCYREGNKVADKLANIGVEQTDRLMMYHSPIAEIANLLREDFIGVTTPRLIA